MRGCEQPRGLDVLAHGDRVAEAYARLLAHLTRGEPLPAGWRVPSWLAAQPDVFLQRLMDGSTLHTYQRYHDCGKPYCLQIDADGRRHFPGHATLSAQVWRALGGDEPVARLMAQDMDAHLLAAQDVPEFARRPEAASLWLTALAEVHANAEMFGGLESSSFKAKVKHLDRRGKALLACWAEGSPS